MEQDSLKLFESNTRQLIHRGVGFVVGSADKRELFSKRKLAAMKLAGFRFIFYKFKFLKNQIQAHYYYSTAAKRELERRFLTTCLKII